MNTLDEIIQLEKTIKIIRAHMDICICDHGKNLSLLDNFAICDIVIRARDVLKMKQIIKGNKDRDDVFKTVITFNWDTPGECVIYEYTTGVNPDSPEEIVIKENGMYIVSIPSDTRRVFTEYMSYEDRTSLENIVRHVFSFVRAISKK